VEIAGQLKKPIKSIDNALQRVKKKVEKHVFNHNEFPGYRPAR
jgi:RNA polymerase sporulation-specific sigma factor